MCESRGCQTCFVDRVLYRADNATAAEERGKITLGALTGYLQEQFEQACPAGWSCTREVAVLSPHWQRVLGYSPRADVLLSRDDGSRRIWIEFEVSRADPVANHAKFATSHLFQPQLPTDSFVAMVSPHVARGRRYLAARTILLMRRVGMNAFQTVLLPGISPVEIKRLNHETELEISHRSLDASAEVKRAILIASPLASTDRYRLHYAGDPLEVMSSVIRFNDELATKNGRDLWGLRRIQYFVYDNQSRLFAPAKFAAYVNASPESSGMITEHQQGMSMTLYSSLDETEPKFDGNLAQTHLRKRLHMRLLNPSQSPAIEKAFSLWIDRLSNQVRVHRGGPKILIAPSWM